MDNLLEKSIVEVFNKNVHEVTENGDPQRNKDGSIQKKTSWKTAAVDRQGRKFNSKIHGKEPTLDIEGYLTVRRRDSVLSKPGDTRTESFVNKHREPGYAYYVMNDEGGRMEQFVANDWEPVSTAAGAATLKVGQARDGNTVAHLMKKPIEWYEADQRRKTERNQSRFKQTTSPKEESDQYDTKENSHLR